MLISSNYDRRQEEAYYTRSQISGMKEAWFWVGVATGSLLSVGAILAAFKFGNVVLN